MTNDLSSYPAYKNTGLPWLNSIPAEWRILRGKNVFSVVDVRSETGEEELLTVSSSDGVVPRSQKTVTMFKAESYMGYKLCWPGDLVINSLWAWMQGLGFSKHHGIVSSAYGVYRPKSAYVRQWCFFDYLLRSAVYKWELLTRSKGIWLSRLQLSDPVFLDMPIVVPPQEDAESIVRFLNHSDRLIRRYIRAKRRLIELLNEQKQAIIHHAVTHGLDPNVKLKPSGTKWLGEVPEHWEVWRIGHFAKVGNGSTPSRGNSSYWASNGYPWLNSSSVNQGYISHADQFVTKKALKECHLPRVAPLSVLVAITGQGKTRGTAALLGFEATINQHIAYITPTRNIVSPEFLQLSILGAYKELRAISDDSGSTKGALTCEDLKHFQVALPSTDEQQALVAIIRSEVADTERTIAQWERQIALMREYRTRLIADVVTGKLDVRDAAAGLREEIEAKIVSELSEAESVDETGSNASEHDIPLNDE